MSVLVTCVCVSLRRLVSGNSVSVMFFFESRRIKKQVGHVLSHPKNPCMGELSYIYQTQLNVGKYPIHGSYGS